jgi:hypothetical protein
LPTVLAPAGKAAFAFEFPRLSDWVLECTGGVA